MGAGLCVVGEGECYLDAKAHLDSFPEKLADDDSLITLTYRRKPVLAVMSWEAYISLSETMEILSAPDLMAQLREQNGETVQIEEVLARIERDQGGQSTQRA
ncbi:MAG: hypothetical protein CMO68_07420 [Verrucomicrobiales bacterium]|nr:hypothetical protein [Verrucomicrobiales bacterium]|tara:strand:+ start:719 stop:1024 length:306 start_codon:yes stop_codon:yes gene_type:complete